MQGSKPEITWVACTGVSWQSVHPNGPSPEGGSVGDEVITCPTLRSKLQARESPFLRGNYHGGGFTSDNDRVLLQSVYFADRHSAGNRSQDRLEALSVQMKKASFKNAAIDDATSDL